MMSKVKITILKTALNEDLAKEYEVKGLLFDKFNATN